MNWVGVDTRLRRPSQGARILALFSLRPNSRAHPFGRPLFLLPDANKAGGVPKWGLLCPLNGEEGTWGCCASQTVFSDGVRFVNIIKGGGEGEAEGRRGGGSAYRQLRLGPKDVCRGHGRPRFRGQWGTREENQDPERPGDMRFGNTFRASSGRRDRR